LVSSKRCALWSLVIICRPGGQRLTTRSETSPSKSIDDVPHLATCMRVTCVSVQMAAVATEIRSSRYSGVQTTVSRSTTSGCSL
jgi:hypothetical protein